MKVPAPMALLVALLSLPVALPVSAQNPESRLESITPRSRLPSALGGQARRMDGHARGILMTGHGKILGTLKDFVVDPATGRIVDIVTAIPDRAASIDRFVAVPWEVTQWNAGTFVFIEDEIVLQQAPRVSQEVWRHQSPTEWIPAAHRYWQKRGKRRFADAHSSRSALYKVSDLIGITVHSGDGTDLGTITEVGLHPKDGKIAYAVVFGKDPLGSGSSTLFRLPWNVLHLNPHQHTVIATLEPQMDI